MSGIKKIGVFGGAFDPPHSGHLKIIKESLIQLGLDRLYVVVSGDPWMKRDRVVANKHQRQEMIKIALSAYCKNLTFFSMKVLDLKYSKDYQEEVFIYSNEWLKKEQ